MADWTVLFLDERVKDEYSSLPKEIQARFQRIFRLLEANGTGAMMMPLARHLKGKLWEIRASGKDLTARGMVVTATGQRFVVLRFFVKKTQKTPLKELALALERLKEASL